jgi:hypothetical protein
MKRLVFLLALSSTLVGCSDHYRYPCQDPANKDKAECNPPACEVDGTCYNKLNGLPEQPAPAPAAEESAVPVATEEHCNCKGE